MADPITPTNPAPKRNWDHAGEDYEPEDIGVPGFEVADDKFLAQVLADAAKAVEDKKNAKEIFKIVIESIRTGVNILRPL